jgi:hypothetical protein
MKYMILLAATALTIASCGGNSSADTKTTGGDSAAADNTRNADTAGPLKDTVPTGSSTSTSDFSKGNALPDGSTGDVDSTHVKPDSLSKKVVKEKKAKKDSTH